MALLVTDNQGGEIHETPFLEIEPALTHLRTILVNTEHDQLINIHITKIFPDENSF